jgi:hypothetical protein
MHVLKQILLMMVLCLAVQWWLPWWTLVFPIFIISYGTSRSGIGSFMAGFIAIGVLWFGMAWYIDFATSSTLSQKVAMLFQGISVTLLRLITALVGGLTGGFTSLTAYSLKNLR